METDEPRSSTRMRRAMMLWCENLRGRRAGGSVSCSLAMRYTTFSLCESCWYGFAGEIAKVDMDVDGGGGIGNRVYAPFIRRR